MKMKMKVPLLFLLLFVCFLAVVSSSQGKQLMQNTKPSQGPSAAPASAPTYSRPTLAPHHRHKFRRHHHHHHKLRPYATALTPDAAAGCDQTCVNPFTATPSGTPCGCVIPMKVRILLSIAVYALFPEVNEFEREIAMGAYLKQNQVQIVGASSDSQNQERTVVDVNLVPLSERFDNTTAILTYERLWRKEVPLNRTLFGNYDVVDVHYPGIPSQFPPEGYVGSGPAGSDGE